MKNLIFLIISVCVGAFPVIAQTNTADHLQHHHAMHASDHANHLFSMAPISVTGDHLHHKNGLMISYRYMYMKMEDNLNGSNAIDDADVFSNYMVSPQSMNMNMHMLGLMYAPTDHITFMLMSNYLSNNMQLKSNMGMEFETQSEGIGDSKFTTLFQLVQKEKGSLIAGVGVSVPTGSIHERDDTPMMSNMFLAYPMQNGSGTWDPNLSVNYLLELEKIGIGIQTKYKTRIGENNADYTLGDEFATSCWGVYKASSAISFSVRAQYLNIGSIDGADSDLNPMMMPLANTINTGMEKLDLFAGINLYQFDGIIKGIKVGAEFGYPLYQDLDGIQMKRSAIATIGVQYNLIKH